MAAPSSPSAAIPTGVGAGICDRRNRCRSPAVDARLLAWRLSGGISSIRNESDDGGEGPDKCISAGVNALQQMFAAAVLGTTPDLQTVTAASAEVVASLEEEGLSRWLDVVRNHHSQTYQHSLVVTAVAVSFGRHLGFSQTDKSELLRQGCCTTSARHAFR